MYGYVEYSCVNASILDVIDSFLLCNSIQTSYLKLHLYNIVDSHLNTISDIKKKIS